MEKASNGKNNHNMTLENLVHTIMLREGIDREQDIAFIYEDNIFKATVVTHDDIIDSTGNTLFLAFKRMYQKLYKEPVIEVPNGYFTSDFEEIIKKLSVLKQHIYVLRLKSGKWELSMKVPFKDVDARGIGEHWNHALTYVHSALMEHGIDIKI